MSVQRTSYILPIEASILASLCKIIICSRYPLASSLHPSSVEVGARYPPGNGREKTITFVVECYVTTRTVSYTSLRVHYSLQPPPDMTTFYSFATSHFITIPVTEIRFIITLPWLYIYSISQRSNSHHWIHILAHATAGHVLNKPLHA